MKIKEKTKIYLMFYWPDWEDKIYLKKTTYESILCVQSKSLQ